MSTIVKAELSDAPAIAAINEQFRLNIPNFRWGTLEWVKKEIGKENYYIIRDENGVAATLCLELASEEHVNAGVIEALAVRSDLRGTGYGQEMIEYAKNTCSQNPSLKRLVVESFKEYDPSIKRFYERSGFKLAPETRSFEGHDYYHFCMEIKQSRQSLMRDTPRGM